MRAGIGAQKMMTFGRLLGGAAAGGRPAELWFFLANVEKSYSPLASRAGVRRVSRASRHASSPSGAASVAFGYQRLHLLGSWLFGIAIFS